MSRSNVQKTIAAIVALGVSTAANQASAAPDAPTEWEKCLGIAKKEMNECSSTDGKHDCAGASEKDGDVTEWIYVPKGTCEKIVNGKVWKVVPANKG